MQQLDAQAGVGNFGAITHPTLHRALLHLLLPRVQALQRLQRIGATARPQCCCDTRHVVDWVELVQLRLDNRMEGRA